VAPRNAQENSAFAELTRKLAVLLF